MSERCGAVIQFADDFGDNDTTFTCGLEPGHDGPHQENGTLKCDQQAYSVIWEDILQEITHDH